MDCFMLLVQHCQSNIKNVTDHLFWISWKCSINSYTTCPFYVTFEVVRNRAFVFRVETKALIGGGGGAYSYISVLPDEFLLKSTVMTTDFKTNSSGRTRIYEYTPPPPN